MISTPPSCGSYLETPTPSTVQTGSGPKSAICIGAACLSTRSGPLIGRPRTATFRLLDLVGIDVMALVDENLYPRIPDDESRELLRSPRMSGLVRTMVEMPSSHLIARGLREVLVGEDPLAIDRLWHVMYRASYHYGRAGAWDVTSGHFSPAPDRTELLGRSLGRDGIRRCLECHTTSPHAALLNTAPLATDSREMMFSVKLSF